jgi:GTP-binding protein
MLNPFLDGMKEYWEELPPYFVTSALKREGREGMLSYIGGLIRALRLQALNLNTGSIF